MFQIIQLADIKIKVQAIVIRTNKIRPRCGWCEMGWQRNIQISQLKKTVSAISHIRSIIHASATTIHSQMHEDFQSGKEVPKGSDLHFFSEEKYIEEKPEEFDEALRALLRETPSVDNIYEFMKALYECAKFSPECCIICLVYINRLIAFTGLPLYPTNWRPLILCSLLVAQKVWDDKYLSNADFAFIYPFFDTEEIDALEEKFLELLQYKIAFKSAEYHKYYFELRALFKNESEFPLIPLDVDQEKQLESRSIQLQNNEKEKAQNSSQNQIEKQTRNPNTIFNNS